VRAVSEMGNKKIFDWEYCDKYRDWRWTDFLPLGGFFHDKRNLRNLENQGLQRAPGSSLFGGDLTGLAY